MITAILAADKDLNTIYERVAEKPEKPDPKPKKDPTAKKDLGKKKET